MLVNGTTSKFRGTWKAPRDGKEFVGFLAGGRRDTRKEIIDLLWERYAIRIVAHIGHEQRREMNTFIPSHVEVVVIIGDDIDDRQLQRVLKCTRAIGAENIGIERKKVRPEQLDAIFAGNGYSSPPVFRDGALIVNKADPKALEEQRKAELAAIEDTRPAWVDPKLVVEGAPKLGAVISSKLIDETLNKYKPETKKEEPVPAPEPKKKGSKVPPGTRSADVGSTPWAAEVVRLREALGISQGEAGRRLGMAQGVLSSYERGQSIPLYVAYLRMLELFPSLSEPPDIKGKKSYEASLKGKGVNVKPVKATPPAPTPAPPKTAQAAFGAAPAPTPAPAAIPLFMPPPAPPVPPELVVRPELAAAGEAVTVKLKSGGTLELRASVSLLKLKGPDRAFVFDLIDMLQNYEASNT